MSSNLESEFELCEMCLDLIGMQGPVIVDTGIAAHDYSLEEDFSEKEYAQLLEADKITIGEAGREITKDDIKLFIKNVMRHSSNEAFEDSGRSYFFEGVGETRRGWKFCWGS
jgi:hypothetical protein